MVDNWMVVELIGVLLWFKQLMFVRKIRTKWQSLGQSRCSF